MTNENIKASEAVRAFAEEYGIDLSTVHGSGKDGAIVMADVKAFAEDKPLEKLSPEWVAAKREAKKALDERLGTARNVVVREDRR